MYPTVAKSVSKQIDAHLHITRPHVQFVAATPNLMKVIETSGRTCYLSEPKETGADQFVERLIGRKHESVLEHGVVTFKIVTDRGVTHELVRHRVGAAYSQESTRYCSYSECGKHHGMSVLIPSTVRPENEWIFIKGFEAAQHYYEMALAAGEPPQNARALLPTGVKTTIVVTFNIREWRHFIKLRAAKDAHPDIRIIAKACGMALLQRYWHAFADLRELIESVPAELSVSRVGAVNNVESFVSKPLIAPTKSNDRRSNASAQFLWLPFVEINGIVMAQPSVIFAESAAKGRERRNDALAQARALKQTQKAAVNLMVAGAACAAQEHAKQAAATT